MKRYLYLLCLGCLAVGGCTRTKYKDFDRTTFFQKTNVRELTVRPDGSLIMRGYENDGGAGSVEAAARGAAEGTMNGMRPGP